jgi:hypothetical protein
MAWYGTVPGLVPEAHDKISFRRAGVIPQLLFPYPQHQVSKGKGLLGPVNSCSKSRFYGTKRKQKQKQNKNKNKTKTKTKQKQRKGSLT